MAGKNVLPLESVSEIIRKMRASGLSPFAFARREGIIYTTLRGYMRRFRKAGLDPDSSLSSGGRSSASAPVSTRSDDMKKVSGGRYSAAQKKAGGFVELVSEKSAGDTFSLHCSQFRFEFPLSSLSLVLAEIKNHA